MRLNAEQIEVIRKATRSVFGQGAMVRVFGSRLDDKVKGGDIDLLVECPEAVADRLKKTLTLTARLQRALGDQPIDILVTDPSTQIQRVHELARRTGVTL